MSSSSDFEGNLYRLTDSPIDATKREIRRHLDEFSTKLALGITTDGFTSESLSRLYDVLDDAKLRLEHEIFWYWSAESKRFEPANPPKLSVVQRMLKNLHDSANALPVEQTTVQRHDLALLCLHSFAAEPTQIVYLQVSLTQWRLLQEAGFFWSHIQKRAVEIDHVRLGEVFLRELRATFPETLVDKISRIVNRREIEIAIRRELISTLRTAFPSSAAAKSLIQEMVTTERSAFYLQLERLKDSIRALVNSEVAGAAKIANAQSAYNCFYKDAIPTLVSLTYLDPDSQFVRESDDLSRSAINLAFAVANESDDWVNAGAISSKAIELARSTSVREEVSRDRLILQRNYHVYSAAICRQNRSYLEAAVHLEIAASLLPEEDNTQLLSAASYERSRGLSTSYQSIDQIRRQVLAHVWQTTRQSRDLSRSVTTQTTYVPGSVATERDTRSWISRHKVWGIVATGVVGFLIYASASNPEKLTPAQASCHTRVARTVSASKIELTKGDALLSQYGATIDAYETRLAVIDATYPGSYAPNNVVGTYNAMIDRHDALVDPYNTILRRRPTLVAGVNTSNQQC